MNIKRVDFVNHVILPGNNRNNSSNCLSDRDKVKISLEKGLVILRKDNNHPVLVPMTNVKFMIVEEAEEKEPTTRKKKQDI